jgi:aryl-alcohol dehydrogenase-like predicted oxidoreductase
MIGQLEFGKTGHKTSRLIFGSYALSQATPQQAEQTFLKLISFGVNHIDTAPMYGNAEKLIGSWFEQNRDQFFVATKTRSRSHEGAWKNLMRSLERLRIDSVDLWQMHGLTNPVGWEKAMGPGGTLEAFIKAREEGLVRFLGVTGHGTNAPAMLLRSLSHFDFDSVMVPYNYSLMQKPRYAEEFKSLVERCQNKRVALQTIKSIARRPWGNSPKTHNTYFYEPLVNQNGIDNAVHWALGLENSFFVSAGDLEVLPMVLDAANRFFCCPSKDQMAEDAAEYGIEAIFK